MIDPHTADGVHVARRSGVEGPIIVLETALPIKFSDTIVEAIGMVPPLPARFEDLMDLPRHVIDAPNDAAAVRAIIEERAGV